MSAAVSVTQVELAAGQLADARRSLQTAINKVTEVAEMLKEEAKWADETTEGGKIITRSAKDADSLKQGLMKQMIDFPSVAPLLVAAENIRGNQTPSNIIRADFHASRAAEQNLGKAVK